MRTTIGVEAEAVLIIGHGATIPSQFELAPGIIIEPGIPKIELQDAADNAADFDAYAAVLNGREIGNFTLRVEGQGERLAIRGWNALWDFHLLSLAAEVPVSSVFSISNGPKPVYSAANRANFRPYPNVEPLSIERLEWAQRHKDSFDALIKSETFSAAMRAYGNSHTLFDQDLRIMLLWSGIERLLSVDAELTRRIALYAAIMLDGTHAEKMRWFADVKKAYIVRSKAVHGGGIKSEAMKEGLAQANRIILRLLRRCVEIRRVPTPEELDALAVNTSIA